MNDSMYFTILLILFGVTISVSLDYAYGLWIPASPEELVQQSQTIFVGTITEINLVEVEYQSQIARNGTLKDSVGTETIQLEEYTVHVEKFLKNPQDTNTMKVLRATVSGVPGTPAKISGFDVGDKVLFYLPNDKRQTHFEGQYLPESCLIESSCTGGQISHILTINESNQQDLIIPIIILVIVVGIVVFVIWKKPRLSTKHQKN